MTNPSQVTLNSLTKTAREAVLTFARRNGAALGAAFAVVRSDRKSRAVGFWTTYGSGSSRRVYSSTLDGSTIDTESARYPMTVHAESAIREYTDSIEGWAKSNCASLISEIERAIGTCDAPRKPYTVSCS